ncbi:MAG: hypothetical protein EOP10_15265 [Proteobacteria bacterium]|nr:MAG: hypothetical protein EOP10_15265 [Pseudomonadota bacterium]
MHRFHQSDLVEAIKSASRESPLLYGTGQDIPKSRLHRLRTAQAWLKLECRKPSRAKAGSRVGAAPAQLFFSH